MADERPEHEDLHAMQVALYAEKIADVLAAADATDDPQYRGLTIPKLHLALGKDARPHLTVDALKSAKAFEHGAQLCRYTLIDRRVKQVCPSEWFKYEVPQTRRELGKTEWPARDSVVGRKVGV